MRPVTHFFCRLFLLLLAVPATVQAAPVVVSDITVTDVSPNSFSVLWNGNQAAICSLRVYSDADGTQEITSQVDVTPFPLKGPHSSVRDAAREQGVLLARVSGLDAAATYYFQTVTIAAVTGDVTLEPAGPQFPAVTTQDNAVRTDTPDTTEYFFTNDTLVVNTPLENGTDPVEGTVVAIQVLGSDYPVTGFVGDGVPVPYAAMDTANVFDDTQHLNLPLKGGEEILVTRYLGVNGTQTFRSYLLPPRNLAELRGPIGLYEVVRVLQITTDRPGVSLDLDYDINGDGRIGMEESLYFMQIMADLR